MYKIRKGTKEDLDKAIVLCHGASFQANEVLHEDNARKFIESVIDQEGFFILLEHNDEPCGILIGIITKHPYFDIPSYAQEIVWFVEPEHRGNKKSVYMLRDFMKWAKEQECERVTMSTFLQEHYDSCNKIYLKAGFTPKEVQYEREL